MLSMPIDVAVLAANLRRQRTLKGITQGDLAAKSRISRLAYLRIEAGEVTPRVDTLLQIAEALETPVQDLLMPVRELRRVRFRADKTMNTRAELLQAYDELRQGTFIKR